MPTIEVNVSDDTARSLTYEADHLGFDDVGEYVGWVIARRYSLEADDERVRRLATLDNAHGGSETHTIGGSVERTVRVTDENLEADADTLSTVETDRIDAFARRAVKETRSRLGSGLDTGLEYDSSTSLSSSNGRRPGEELVDFDEVDVPGYDETLIERRRVALGAAVVFLRECEEATRSDFVDRLYEEMPAGYESEDSWWECIKTGLRQIDRVDPAGHSSRIWRYRTTAGRITRRSF